MLFSEIAQRYNLNGEWYLLIVLDAALCSLKKQQLVGYSQDENRHMLTNNICAPTQQSSLRAGCSVTKNNQ